MKEAVHLAEKHSKVSPHWFRHSFVTMFLENNVPLAVVKD
ncbi:site-specific integrase [Viridibacillus sp. YIM B01967]|uniref:Site-specific integrase n=1 Tax=Viridibacillus soli TaxID=2798301 RepID=A0ABS1H2R4_9BACL|nr:site-specific integrase [Viridibacillus soli]